MQCCINNPVNTSSGPVQCLGLQDLGNAGKGCLFCGSIREGRNEGTGALVETLQKRMKE